MSLLHRVIPCTFVVTVAIVAGAPVGPSAADDPPETGSLTLRASVQYTSGWSPPTAPKFSFSSALGNFQLGHDETAAFPNLTPGDYSVTLALDPDYTFFSVTCTGNLDFDTTVNFNTGQLTVGVDPGENITCTFSNNRRTGQVRVVTESIGGTSVTPWTYNLTPTGGGAGPTPFASLADNTQTSLANVPTGTYTLTQNELPDGWITSIDCGDGPIDGGNITIEVTSGSSTTCTATNTRRGSVTIRKSVSYNSSWSVDADRSFDFSSDLGAFSLAHLETRSFTDLAPGDYTFTETLVPGWFFFAVACTGNLDFDTTVNFNTGQLTLGVDPGENITCTFSNNRDTGRLRIIETTVGGTAPTVNWTYDLQPTTGNSLTTPFATVPDGGQTSLVTLPTGTYTLTQKQSNLAWLTSIDCGGGSTTGTSRSVTIAKGVDTTCTVTNTALGPNEAPVLSGPSGPIKVTEGVDFTFAGPNAITLTDPDAYEGILSLTITPSGGATNMPGTLDGTLSELQAALADLTFTPATAGPASVTIHVDDNGYSGTGEPLSDELVVLFDVAKAPNDPPTLVLPRSFPVRQGEVISFTGDRRIVVQRPSSAGVGPIRLTVTATGGTIWYDDSDDATTSSAAAATPAVESPSFVGTLEEVQARLDALRFTITAGPNEWATLSVLVDDASTDDGDGAWSIAETLRLRVAGPLNVELPAPSTTIPPPTEPTVPTNPTVPTSPTEPTNPPPPVDPTDPTQPPATPAPSPPTIPGPDGRLPATGSTPIGPTLFALALIGLGIVLTRPGPRRAPVPGEQRG